MTSAQEPNQPIGPYDPQPGPATTPVTPSLPGNAPTEVPIRKPQEAPAIDPDRAPSVDPTPATPQTPVTPTDPQPRA